MPDPHEQANDSQQAPEGESPPSIPPPETDDTIELEDGRELGYATYGPADGAPLIFCHGTPGSRYTRHPDRSFLERHGIRQVTLERPGYGRSTFQAGRALLDWPEDVREATATLGYEEFAIAGISGGGPHALACAARIPDRLTAVVILNGVGPVSAPGATDGMALRNRLSLYLGRLPLLGRIRTWLAVRAIRNDPDDVLDSIAASFADVDEELLQRPAVRAMFRQDLTEAVRQGSKGWSHDGNLVFGSWGFAVDETATHVDLWHGELDQNAPVPMARYVADELPSCTARIYSDEGHLLILDHWDEILSVVNERMSENTQ